MHGFLLVDSTTETEHADIALRPGALSHASFLLGAPRGAGQSSGQIFPSSFDTTNYN